MPKVHWMLLMGIAFVGSIAWAAFASAAGQTSAPLRAYVGTWIATNNGDSSPFLVLNLSDVNGSLAGTISRFTVDGQRDGKIIYRALPQPPDQISDLEISSSGGDLSFHWTGDPPFQTGEVLFVAEGTAVAYINDLPISQNEVEKIFADNRGLSEFEPTIVLRRQGASSSEVQQVGRNSWKEVTAERLINQAEFRYKFDHDGYVDYSTLLRSDELAKSRSHFTAVPIDLQSETEPFPGHLISLIVSKDGAAYRLSISWKPSASCRELLLSNQTGILVESGAGDCTGAGTE